MKLVLLSSTLLLGTALAAPVPAPPGASDFTAPSSTDTSGPLDLEKEVGGLFAGAEGNGKGTSTGAGNVLPGLPKRASSSTSAAPPASTTGVSDSSFNQLLGDLGLGSDAKSGGASSSNAEAAKALDSMAGKLQQRTPQGSAGGLDLGNTVSGLLGEGGDETGNSGLGGLKKRAPQAGSSLDGVLGDVENATGGSGLAGLPKRAPQGDASSDPLGELGLGSLLGGGALPKRTPQSDAGSDLLGELGLGSLLGGTGLRKRTPQGDASSDPLGELGLGDVLGGGSLPKRAPQGDADSDPLGELGLGDVLGGGSLPKRTPPATDFSSSSSLGNLLPPPSSGNGKGVSGTVDTLLGEKDGKMGDMGIGGLNMRDAPASSTDEQLVSDLDNYLPSGDMMDTGF